ncbi:isocitrate/isopropylmalate dehydrogenase family protein [Candidatus Bathyarchaeota archaeon]|nr:isocitrate/isopropylmalate dehydrogenase family protein [Candidatus Bathyarchaeota archaeon]
MGKYRIAVIPGDGIGPEVVDAAMKVLDAVQDVVKGLTLETVMVEAGLRCIPKYGTNLPEHSIQILKESHVCLKGPVTTPEEPGSPRSAAVTIRRMFDLYANVRPCRSLPNVPCLKPNIDLVIVRENTEDLYSGIEFELTPGVAVALRVITWRACERIVRFAFNLAMKRRKQLAYVHKGNIMKVTDGIFKKAVREVAKEFPDVELWELRVDAAAMQLIKRPEAFDVLVTTNMFGDILSDEAAQLVGGLGFAAGANIGDDYGMFEPVHGSAPKYTGMNKVNPIATITASKMMLEWLGSRYRDEACLKASERIENAILEVLKEGRVRTYDFGGSSTTSEMGEAIAKKVVELG